MQSTFGYQSPLILNLTTFSVLVSVFFGILFPLVEYLGVLQQSADTFSQNHLNHNRNNTFDYIIVGGGTAGCVLANRLSQNPQNRVLLLEIGGDPNPLTQIPILSSENLGISSSKLGNYYKTTVQTAACGSTGGKCTIVTGKNLGGGTNINILINTRGSPQIYDKWAQITRNPIWKYENVLKFFKKSEDYHGYYEPFDSRYHSTGGEWYVSNADRSDTSPAVDYFLNAAKANGFPLIDINNGAQARNGGSLHFDFNIKHGQRWGTYKAFLQPILTRPNLYVSRYSSVTRILLDKNRRAIGVSYTKNGVKQDAHCRKEVILSAGTFGTAELLMLSGIGPKHDLRTLGIPVRVDLPVGKTLFDHTFLPILFTLNKKLFFYPKRDTEPSDVFNYVTNQTGYYAKSLSVRAAIYAKSSVARQIKNCYPDLELNYGSYLGTPPLSLTGGKDYFALSILGIAPKSVGQFKLSGSPGGGPIINPNLLVHPDDMTATLEGIQLAVKVIHSSAEFKSAGIALPPLPACVGFPKNSTAYWTCYAKTMTSSGAHPVGTCPMGTDSSKAVVDSKLRVFGVSGLRIIDASVMPLIPNAHTTAPTVMIAEVGSSLILD